MELHVYDFDGTLFGSPGPPEDYDPGIDEWFRNPNSLGPPCVPLEPGTEWWDASTVSDARASIADPNVYTVVMTGRQHRVTEIGRRVRELLAGAGLSFDEVHLKPGNTEGGLRTADFKRETLAELLQAMPEVTLVRVWDDRSHHLPIITSAAEELGVRAVHHPVSRHSLPPACSPEELAEWQREQELQGLSEIASRIIMEQEGF